MNAELWSALGLGTLLGVRHALDGDHVAAVTAILSRHRTARRAAWVGAWWGVGHSVMLLVVGVTVVGFKLAIPDRTALSFELLVGGMLVLLGGRVLWQLAHEHWHWHVHQHADGTRHAHLHAHGQSETHDHAHSLRFGARPLVVGMVHGLAGSAGLTLLVGAAMPSLAAAVAYFALFGIGSIAGMSVLTMAISVPFTATADRLGAAYRALVLLAGLGSVAVGVHLIYQVGWVQGLFGAGAS